MDYEVYEASRSRTIFYELLTSLQIDKVERYWLELVQETAFSSEIAISIMLESCDSAARYWPSSLG